MTLRVDRPALVHRLGAAVKYFQIDAAGWKRFTALIDRPAQHKPGLEKLFARPSVFRRT